MTSFGVPRVSAADPETLRFVEQRGGATYAVDAAGNRIVAGLGPRVAVFRLAEGGLELVAHTPVMSAVVEEIALAGDRVLVGLRGGDVHVVDLQDPLRPRIGPRLVPGIARRHADGSPSLPPAMPPHPSMAWTANGRVGVVVYGRGLRAFDLQHALTPGPAQTMLFDGQIVGVTGGDVGIVAAEKHGPLHRIQLDDTGALARPIDSRPVPQSFFFHQLFDGRGEQLLMSTDALTLGVFDLGTGLFDTMFLRPRALERGVSGPWRAWLAALGSGEIVSTALRPDSVTLDAKSSDSHPLPDGAEAYDLAVTNGHLVVAGGAGGLLVYRLDGTAHPPLVAQYRDPLPTVLDVAVIEGGKRLIATTSSGWCKLDSFQPLRVQACTDTAEPPLAVASDGRWALVATHEDRSPPPPRPLVESVTIVHVLGPDGQGGTRLVRTIERTSDGRPRAAVVRGGRGYVVTDRGRLLTIEMDAEPLPRVVGKIDLDIDATDISVANGLALVAYARGGLGGAMPVDLTPSAPQPPRRGTDLQMSMGRISPKVGLMGAIAVFANGNAAQVVETSPDGTLRPIGLIDMPPASPSPLRFELPGMMPGGDGLSRDGVGLNVAGGSVWLAQGAAGLHRLDLSLPNHPEALPVYDTPGSALASAIAGPWVTVADGDGGLLVLRRADGAWSARAFLPRVMR